MHFVRKASAVWKGTLKQGGGSLKLESGAFEGPYNFVSRFESGNTTNPEELIGAAHAGCFSMFLSAVLTEAGYTPTSIHTTAEVHLVDGPKVSLIELTTEAVVPGLDEKTFLEAADKSKKNCPISLALAAVEIKLNARLVG